MNLEPICRFAEVLRSLSRHKTAESFERAWDALPPGTIGWDALPGAWRRNGRVWELALVEVDALLLRLLARLDVLTRNGGEAAERIDVFSRAELERLQHATAAALVVQRFGTAGLRTVLDDRGAPKARRYFALLAAADRHPSKLWPLFRRYLEPGMDHAFQAAAAEAARFYPEHTPSATLLDLFESIRHDEYLRAFLSPRILESLFVLNNVEALPFWRELLISGYTHADPEWCEVTRALVMVRRLTGRIEPSVKFEDHDVGRATAAVDRAEEIYRRSAPELHPVSLI